MQNLSRVRSKISLSGREREREKSYKLVSSSTPNPSLTSLPLLRHGGKQGSVTRCRKCQGSGIEVKLRQIGPGMMQQMQSKCSDCQGSGDFIREKDRCKKCKGKRVMELDHKLEVGETRGGCSSLGIKDLEVCGGQCA